MRGHRVLCAVNSLNGRRIPQKGARVLVAIPFEMAEVAGAPMIIAAAENDRRDNLSKGETSIGASEGTGRVVMRNDGTVSLLTTTDNTPDGKVVVFSVGPSGLKFAGPWGSLVLDATGFHLKTKAGPRLDMGGIAIPGLPDEIAGAFSGYITMTSPMIKVAGGSVYLGAGSVFNPAMYLPVDQTQPPPLPKTSSIQSQSVWVCP